MRTHLLMLTCVFHQLVGCSELPAPATDRHLAQHHYCVQSTEPVCSLPASVSLGGLFR
ncbi:hypothetical protein HNR03_000292 [Pseudomonas sp. JAI111]|nr:hypothetical protein [Pseudomonas sp. JAI111]